MKYFNIQEFVCKCGQCASAGSAQAMPSGVQANIDALVNNVLDPLREAYGKPIYVNSGHRCEAYNRKVGGVSRSQHIVGEAADIHCDDNAKLAKLIVQQGRFDQLIIYPTFLHVSYKRSGANRHRVLRKTAKRKEK